MTYMEKQAFTRTTITVSDAPNKMKWVLTPDCGVWLVKTLEKRGKEWVEIKPEEHWSRQFAEDLFGIKWTD